MLTQSSIINIGEENSPTWSYRPECSAKTLRLKDCEPQWSEKELAHKAADAAKADHAKPRGYLADSAQLDDHQRVEAAWTLSNKPIASGKVAPTSLTTFTTLNPKSYRKGVLKT